MARASNCCNFSTPGGRSIRRPSPQGASFPPCFFLEGGGNSRHLEIVATKVSGMLLPETVDDYVGADNPVRFIDAFVDQLDLAAAGFIRVAPKATGRPGYPPGDLLKLYI